MEPVPAGMWMLGSCKGLGLSSGRECALCFPAKPASPSQSPDRPEAFLSSAAFPGTHLNGHFSFP